MEWLSGGEWHGLEFALCTLQSRFNVGTVELD